MGAEPPQELADTLHAAWVRFACTGTLVGRVTANPNAQRCCSTPSVALSPIPPVPSAACGRAAYCVPNSGGAASAVSTRRIHSTSGLCRPEEVNQQEPWRA